MPTEDRGITVVLYKQISTGNAQTSVTALYGLPTAPIRFRSSYRIQFSSSKDATAGGTEADLWHHVRHVWASLLSSNEGSFCHERRILKMRCSP